MEQNNDTKQIKKDAQLVDSENIMMITTVNHAKELLKYVFDEMVLVTRWIPCEGPEIGFSFEKRPKKYNSNLNKGLKPSIKNIDVTWYYSEDKIKKALKIMELMGWRNPEMYSPRIAFPMMIKSGRRFNDSALETVILIAPRIETE